MREHKYLVIINKFLNRIKMKITNKKIPVTGAATGIGFALAERFIKDGNIVIVCGRREPALNEAKAKLPSLITNVCDLSIKEILNIKDFNSFLTNSG